VIGDLTKKNILATTIRTLSMLLSAGIPLVEALKIVANIAGNIVYMEAFLKIGERVQKGFSIANSFEETGVFPLIVNQMVATGEATGKLDEVLLKVADYFASEAEQSVKSLTSAIEPLIMIVLGLGVGFLVVAVVMPIYNLTSQF
jgi:type IV pilus assembly protein PilC